MRGSSINIYCKYAHSSINPVNIIKNGGNRGAVGKGAIPHATSSTVLLRLTNHIVDINHRRGLRMIDARMVRN